MKKQYLLLILCLLSFHGFSTTFLINLPDQGMLEMGHAWELSNETILVHNQIINDEYKYIDKLFLYSADGILIRERVFENFVIRDMAEAGIDSLLLIGHEFVDSTVSKTRIIWLDWNLEIKAQDSILIENPRFYNAQLQVIADTCYFFTAYHTTLQTELIAGKFQVRSGEIVDTMHRWINGHGMEKLLVNSDGDIFILKPLAKYISISRDLKTVESNILSDGNLIAYYDYLFHENAFYITGSYVLLESLNRIPIERFSENLEPISKFEVVFNNSLNYPGYYSTLAQQENYLYFAAEGHSDSSSHIYMSRFTYDFNLEWEKYIDWPDLYGLYSVKPTRSGGCLLLLASKDTLDKKFNVNLHLIKMNASGNYNFIAPVETFSKLVNTFPNPVQDTWNVELLREIPGAQINILASSGHQVLSSSVHNEKVQFNLSKLAPGFYIYQLTDGLRVLDSGKLIKK